MAEKRSFNYLNLFYGLGAVIILIAAMFKFVGWSYANEFFIFGIAIEAVVFLISAFDWGGSAKESYEWEKVFPQLNSEGGVDNTPMSAQIAEGTQQQQIQQIMETIISLNGSVNELNAATKKLTGSVGMMEENYTKISSSTQQYQEELDRLRNKLTSANDKLRAFDSFNFQGEGERQ